jgi:hypothetical protein
VDDTIPCNYVACMAECFERTNARKGSTYTNDCEYFGGQSAIFYCLSHIRSHFIIYSIYLSHPQMVSLLIGVIFYGQILDQDGVMNINGALFLFLTNMTFQNVFSVINVSLSYF